MFARMYDGFHPAHQPLHCGHNQDKLEHRHDILLTSHHQKSYGRLLQVRNNLDQCMKNFLVHFFLSSREYVRTLLVQQTTAIAEKTVRLFLSSKPVRR